MFELTLGQRVGAAVGIVLAAVLALAVIHLLQGRGNKTRTRDSLAREAEAALAADADPLGTAERMLRHAVSYWAAWRERYQIKLSLLMLAVVLVNDAVFGLGTMSLFVGWMACAFVALGLIGVDASTYYNVVTEFRADRRVSGGALAIIIAGYLTTIVVSWGNGMYLQRTLVVNADGHAGDYTSLQTKRANREKAVAALVQQETTQSDLLTTTTAIVQRESADCSNPQIEGRCPRMRDATRRQASQQAALDSIRQRLTEERSELAAIEARLTDARASGMTSAAQQIGDYLSIPVLMVVILVFAQLQWFAAAAEFQEWKRARLHAAADKIRDRFGEDILRRAVLGMAPADQQTAIERVEFFDVRQVQKIEIVQHADVPKTPQHRDILKLFQSGYILKSVAEDTVTLADILAAYKALPESEREGANMTDYAVLAISRDALRYVDDADLNKDGIQGWKINRSRVPAA